MAFSGLHAGSLARETRRLNGSTLRNKNNSTELPSRSILTVSADTV
jgi:hypothetical protein